MRVDEAALEVVTSELVTNAVLHARTSMTVRLRPIAGFLEVEVDDEGPGMSDPRIPSTAGGQGLRLVEALTAAAGITALNGGMRAWCRLAVRNP